MATEAVATATVPRTTAAWVDLVSPSHPFFFRALVDGLESVTATVTVRKKTETVPLAREVGFDVRTVGRDFDNPTLRKLGIPLRTAQLGFQAPDADVALCSRNAMCILAAKVRGIPSIHFTDNDITAYVDGLRAEELYNRLEAMATHNVVPAAFDTWELKRWGASSGSIHTYDGLKEHVYVADFEPNPDFLEKLPFDEFVVVRPEAMTAAYVDVDESIVPRLLAEIVDRGLNVVYLPRWRDDEAYAAEFPDDRVYTPPNALNGLDLAWYAQCVLTGSGTMAREAACMETPAVSFFPNSLLSVDQQLVDEGRVFHSRDVDAIGEYLSGLDASDAEPSRERARRVRDEVVSLTQGLIDDLEADR
jgi:predicted glycosyltransferase